MEESTQRRERLKAMRMEASQEDATFNSNSHSAVSLSNPLLESTANPESQTQTVSQSFNYYTNPMAAYSGNKQRNQVSPQTSQNYSSTAPNPQMQQPHGYYANSNYAYSSNPPQSSNLPNPSWRGSSPNPRGYYGPGGVGFPSPQTQFTSGSGQTGYASYRPRPHFTNSPGRGSGRGYPSPGPNLGSGQGGYPSSGPNPHFTNSPGHGPGQGYPSPGPNFRNNSNHGSGPNQGREYGNKMTLGPSSGRGRGGQGGNRGRGHNHVSAEDRPDRFFNRSMVEDPWKFLEPVVWKSLKKQWLPHSVNAKKPRVSESPRQSSSQPSLAAILAASFNEAANDELNDCN